MEKEDLYKKLDIIQNNLKDSHSIGDVEKINYYVAKLNELWKTASVEMLNNAGKDGYFKSKQ